MKRVQKAFVVQKLNTSLRLVISSCNRVLFCFVFLDATVCNHTKLCHRFQIGTLLSLKHRFNPSGWISFSFLESAQPLREHCCRSSSDSKCTTILQYYNNIRKSVSTLNGFSAGHKRLTKYGNFLSFLCLPSHKHTLQLHEENVPFQCICNRKRNYKLHISSQEALTFSK